MGVRRVGGFPSAPAPSRFSARLAQAPLLRVGRASRYAPCRSCARTCWTGEFAQRRGAGGRRSAESQVYTLQKIIFFLVIAYNVCNSDGVFCPFSGVLSLLFPLP